MNAPSPAYLRERLRYDPETGKLFWRAHPAMRPQWNGKHAGREAFTADNGEGYRHGMVDGRKLYAHRVIFAMVHDRWPVETDHEDHGRGNNWADNLKDGDRTANRLNQTRRCDNTSGVTGVYWVPRRLCWLAQMKIRGRQLHLGHFDAFEEALAARRAAEVEHGFHPNHGLPT